MKAYKLFNNNWTCNGFQYEVGKIYEIKGDIALCSKGFHACKKSFSAGIKVSSKSLSGKNK